MKVASSDPTARPPILLPDVEDHLQSRKQRRSLVDGHSPRTDLMIAGTGIRSSGSEVTQHAEPSGESQQQARKRTRRSTDEELRQRREAINSGTMKVLSSHVHTHQSEPGSDTKQQPSRKRLPGTPGTNVHSAYAGISVHNALLDIGPPPAKAKIGSKQLPWLRLTDWEMMNLRKRMKKNAKWAPTDDMVMKELDTLGRGFRNYNTAKTDALSRGVEFTDEDSVGAEEWRRRSSLSDQHFDGPNRGMTLNEAKKRKRETQTGSSEESSHEDLLPTASANKQNSCESEPALRDETTTEVSRPSRADEVRPQLSAGGPGREIVEPHRQFPRAEFSKSSNEVTNPVVGHVGERESKDPKTGNPNRTTKTDLRVRSLHKGDNEKRASNVLPTAKIGVEHKGSGSLWKPRVDAMGKEQQMRMALVYKDEIAQCSKRGLDSLAILPRNILNYILADTPDGLGIDLGEAEDAWRDSAGHIKPNVKPSSSEKKNQALRVARSAAQVQAGRRVPVGAARCAPSTKSNRVEACKATQSSTMGKEEHESTIEVCEARDQSNEAAAGTLGDPMTPKRKPRAPAISTAYNKTAMLIDLTQSPSSDAHASSAIDTEGKVSAQSLDVNELPWPKFGVSVIESSLREKKSAMPSRPPSLLNIRLDYDDDSQLFDSSDNGNGSSGDQPDVLTPATSMDSTLPDKVNSIEFPSTWWNHEAYDETLMPSAEGLVTEPPTTRQVLQASATSNCVPDQDPLKLKQAVDLAVTKSYQLGDPVLGDTIKELYDHSLQNPTLADFLFEVLMRKPPGEQAAEFEARILAAINNHIHRLSQERSHRVHSSTLPSSNLSLVASNSDSSYRNRPQTTSHTSDVSRTSVNTHMAPIISNSSGTQTPSNSQSSNPPNPTKLSLPSQSGVLENVEGSTSVTASITPPVSSRHSSPPAIPATTSVVPVVIASTSSDSQTSSADKSLVPPQTTNALPHTQPKAPIGVAGGSGVMAFNRAKRQARLSGGVGEKSGVRKDAKENSDFKHKRLRDFVVNGKFS